ncbi:hypothetical protein WB391_25510 [Lusitaniella coriacea LEGE 07167]
MRKINLRVPVSPRHPVPLHHPVPPLPHDLFSHRSQSSAPTHPPRLRRSQRQRQQILERLVDARRHDLYRTRTSQLFPALPHLHVRVARRRNPQIRYLSSPEASQR